MGLSRRPVGVRVPAPRGVAAILRAIADLAFELGAEQVVLFGSRAAGIGDALADLDVALVGRDAAAAAALSADAGPGAGIATEVLARLAGAALVTSLSPTHARACVPGAGWLRLDVHAVEVVALRRHRGPRRTVRRRRRAGSADPAPPASSARGSPPSGSPASSPLRFVDAPWRRAAWAAIDALVRVRRGDRDEAELLLAAARRALAADLGSGRDVSGARDLARALDPATLRRWRAARPRSLVAGELRRAAEVVLTIAVGCARRGGDAKAVVVVGHLLCALR